MLSVGLGIMADTCEQSNDPDDGSLSMKLMLLCSIDTSLDLTAYFEQRNLAGAINTVGHPSLSRECFLTFPSS